MQPFLSLENGICAVTVPKLSAAPVLARLAAIGCEGPAMTMATQRGQRVAVLAETDGLIPPRAALPKDVEVLAWGALLPLPIGSRRTDIATEWVAAPNPQQRWLPSLDAVLAAIPARER
ncbi:glycogen operon protein GlgX [Amycolatopsis nalaikhensis]|uniref:Glycogen operon protein GlgX n=2 Tax=Amycolatopsis TaxID=1813 RepID=A0ABY8Y1R0_9PSEU|nr:glycogen operon protein GlgX [Amycolatopsis sp. 2-2]WIV61817.1 glycogen operon protein GlgX [Amycolatopsis sp. 2-2]